MSRWTLRGKLWVPISSFYPSKIGGVVTSMCALTVYSSASNLSHHMWKFSLFSQHHYSVYKRSMHNVFCLAIFIASFLAIKPLWAVLYTSEQVRWPDGCSNKRGEMSRALWRSWAVRRSSPAPHRGAGRGMLARATLCSPGTRTKASPAGMITVLERCCFALPELPDCVS